MTHLIVAPAIHAANTGGFLNSIDPTIAAERLVIVDNTNDRDIHERFRHRVHGTFAEGRNLGVARSWNTGIEYALARGVDFITLASTSIRFHDGGHGLARTADLAAENHQWPYGFESMNGWHLITFGARFFDEVGFFDEEFHPAYFEDNDMIWRARCAGILEPAGGDRAARKIPWIGALKYDCVRDGHAIANCDINVDLAALRDYYTRKWGGPPGEEKWTRPFNRPEVYPAIAGQELTVNWPEQVSP